MWSPCAYSQYGLPKMSSPKWMPDSRWLTVLCALRQWYVSSIFTSSPIIPGRTRVSSYAYQAVLGCLCGFRAGVLHLVLESCRPRQQPGFSDMLRQDKTPVCRGCLSTARSSLTSSSSPVPRRVQSTRVLQYSFLWQFLTVPHQSCYTPMIYRPW